MSKQALSTVKINESMINHAREIAREIRATAALVYVDVIKSPENLQTLAKDRHCIFAARDPGVIDELSKFEGVDDRIVVVPYMNLSRTSQIKVAAMLAFSNGLIKKGNRLVCLSGSPRFGILDSLVVLDIGREFETFHSTDLTIANNISKPYVFDRLLTLAMELAEEGKEGKPIGTTFVLGDHKKVLELSDQMIINPFQAVPEKDRNIMDHNLKETVREFSTLDGAFIIRDDGVIVAAGRHLKAFAEADELPQGLGARHRSAAGITALTNTLAIVISESTGDVRIFSNGKIFMEIEKERKEA